MDNSFGQSSNVGLAIWLSIIGGIVILAIVGFKCVRRVRCCEDCMQRNFGNQAAYSSV